MNKKQYITTSGPVREALERQLYDRMLGGEIFLLIGSKVYRPNSANWTTTSDTYPMVEVESYLSPHQMVPLSEFTLKSKHLTITNVIFNPPATIVFWSDKTKTVVKCDYAFEDYDPEKGIAMAISKKMLGDNKYEYYNIFKHWLKKWDKQSKPETKPDANTRKWTGDMCDA